MNNQEQYRWFPQPQASVLRFLLVLGSGAAIMAERRTGSAMTAFCTVRIAEFKFVASAS
jgi:hypothetical protein